MSRVVEPSTLLLGGPQCIPPPKLHFPLTPPPGSLSTALYDPYRAPVSAVFDHDGPFNQVNGAVRAYNGERGSLNPVIDDGVYGYRRDDGQLFQLPLLKYSDGGIGQAGNDYLFYDGHTGYDYAAGEWTPVRAADDGVVQLTANSYNEVILHHSDGGHTTHYLHMKLPPYLPVLDGQSVKKGQLIGYVSDTSTGQPVGAHLHLTVKTGGANGTPVDPYGDGTNTRLLWEQLPLQ